MSSATLIGTSWMDNPKGLTAASEPCSIFFLPAFWGAQNMIPAFSPSLIIRPYQLLSIIH